jgi:LEM3 (ligand-effect modulator 3) family / CDC50 family
MRTAGLPTFRKLWGSNHNYLASGTWQITITQSNNLLILDFDTAKFGGTKSIVLSSSGLLGGKNGFLGAAYLITGLLCLCLGVAFLIRNMVNPR